MGTILGFWVDGDIRLGTWGRIGTVGVSCFSIPPVIHGDFKVKTKKRVTVERGRLLFYSLRLVT